jgi:pimeloyl-ACP methyl ester carboxylesterase
MSQNSTVAPTRATPPRPRPPRPRRWRRRLGVVLVTLVTLLAGAVVYGAYGYLPAEAGRGYQPHYTRTVPSRFVDTPLARFHYVHAGSGSPVVLLSPGSAWVVGWKEQFSVLARHHSVYVVDLPGQGYTQLHDHSFGWNLAAMTRAIGTFMDAVGVRRAALAGNSWSGGFALAFAQRHPERVSRLALLDATGLDTRDVWTYEVLKYPVVGELLTNLFGASKSTVRGAVDDILVHRERATPELVDDLWAPLTFHDNLRANYLLERGLHWSETQRALTGTHTPTLVLWGRQDKVVPVWQGERLGRLLPDARVRILDGCGHGLELDCPGQVNPLLDGFFQDSEGR